MGQAGQFRFIADGKNACYEIYEPAYHPTHGELYVLNYQIQRSPPGEDWEKFWRVVDKLELARWKPEYSQYDAAPGPRGERLFVTDTGLWSLVVETAKGKREYKGDGAYPKLGHPEQVIGAASTGASVEDALKLLDRAFRELVVVP